MIAERYRHDIKSPADAVYSPIHDPADNGRDVPKADPAYHKSRASIVDPGRFVRPSICGSACCLEPSHDLVEIEARRLLAHREFLETGKPIRR